MWIYIIIGLVLLLLLIALIYFNNFIRFRNRIRNAWSDIDVQLKRRYDLIPNLVEVVKSYASHERNLFENVAQCRTSAMNANNISDHRAASNQLVNNLKTLFAVVENYPVLLANENFIKLQDNLSDIEDHIQMARRYYNAVVRDNNTAVESFPGLIFAGMFGFKSAEFFDIDVLEKEVINVKLN